MALAVTLEKVASEQSNVIGLKWPNDVYMKGKKVAGILIEVIANKLVIGVGVNVSGRALLETATSLVEEGVNLGREELLAGFVKAIFQWGSLCGESYDEIISEYQKRCILTGMW